MTDVPKITREEAAVLAASCREVHNWLPRLSHLDKLGLLDNGWTTDLGRAALANFEAEREREIRAPLEAQKDGAYRERDALVCALSKVFPAHLCRHPDEHREWEDDWRWIVCIHLPTGQATWHIHDSERQHFDHLEVGENHWDGHSTEEKYQRVAALREVTP